MKAVEYVEQYAGDDEELILTIYEEMDELCLKRQIKTIQGMASLFKEFDQKYRKIADSIGLDPDLFEDVVRDCDPQIFWETNIGTMPYFPKRYDF